MEFKSYADLEVDVISLLPRLPRDLDLIVGVPRSGMVPAAMIALHMNLPITDLAGFYEGRLIASGHRKLRPRGSEGLGEAPLKVLIVDDSVGTGAQLREIRHDLARRNLPHRIEIAVIYATPVGAPLVDYFARSMPPLRHFFAWNVMHHNAIGRWCVDIDGVLCRDCSVEEDDQGDRYTRFLQNVEPLFLPTARVGWLITGRLEEHRDATEAWLERHGVAYENLLMHPASSNEERKAMGGGGRFKGDLYRKIDAGLFVESSPYEAREIANLSGKPVLCMESLAIVRPTQIARLRKIATKGPAAYWRFGQRMLDNVREYRRNARLARRAPVASRSPGDRPGNDT